MTTTYYLPVPTLPVLVAGRDGTSLAQGGNSGGAGTISLARTSLPLPVRPSWAAAVPPRTLPYSMEPQVPGPLPASPYSTLSCFGVFRSNVVLDKQWGLQSEPTTPLSQNRVLGTRREVTGWEGLGEMARDTHPEKNKHLSHAVPPPLPSTHTHKQANKGSSQTSGHEGGAQMRAWPTDPCCQQTVTAL